MFSQQQFDDPDGNVELPPKLSKEIETWKRPSEYIVDRVETLASNLLKLQRSTVFCW